MRYSVQSGQARRSCGCVVLHWYSEGGSTALASSVHGPRHAGGTTSEGAFIKSRIGFVGFGVYCCALVTLPPAPRSFHPLGLLGSPSLAGSQVRTYGVLRHLVEQLGYPEGGTGTHYAVPHSTARGGRALGTNHLDGTLPAELGKLTDLEILCAALRRRRTAVADRSAPRLRGAAVCSECGKNKLSGTIGSWIGSMAKLTYV